MLESWLYVHRQVVIAVHRGLYSNLLSQHNDSKIKLIQFSLSKWCSFYIQNHCAFSRYTDRYNEQQNHKMIDSK